MKKKSCIIVDDERLARAILRNMLIDIPDVELIEECANAVQAKLQIEATKPDFILLDIKMPDKNGFELLEDLDYIPQVIFTTAYDDHALKAFKVNALDYLLKPIKQLDLVNALNKIVLSNDDHPIPEQIFIKDGDKCHFIHLNDVLLFSSFGNYVKVHTHNPSVLVKRSLNEIEHRSSENTFFRANRTELINLKMIDNVKLSEKGKIKVILKNQQEIVLSERKSVRFKEKMSL